MLPELCHISPERCHLSAELRHISHQLRSLGMDSHNAGPVQCNEKSADVAFLYDYPGREWSQA